VISAPGIDFEQIAGNSGVISFAKFVWSPDIETGPVSSFQ